MNTSYVPKGPEKGAGGFMEQACTIVLAFFLYSFTGWLCESIYCSLPAGRFINRGFLTGPLCPVYGFGALLIVFLLSAAAAAAGTSLFSWRGGDKPSGVCDRFFAGKNLPYKIMGLFPAAL